ncbi:MAG: START domain-containing protein [Sphingobacteriales bacterium]|nr:START domain-containing protein [Sphingobacteriales bacterium]
MKWLLFFACSALFCHSVMAQYNWKLEKDKNGIKVYLSGVKGSSFKAAKVECNITGTYNKLIALLTNVPHFTDWIYHNKLSRVLKRISPYDFIYYTETSMPWPMSNRDAVIHVQIRTDSLPRFMTITGTGEPRYIPEESGKVRVPYYKAVWKVTMPTAQTLAVTYIVELDPGGSIPAWIANMFAEKGPYESFSNLEEELNK